jgi:hypothetical protein
MPSRVVHCARMHARLIALVLGVLTFTGTAGVIVTRKPSHAGSAAASPVLFNLEAYAYAPHVAAAVAARPYSVVVLQTTDAARIPMLRRLNPHLIILVYQGILKSKRGDPNVCTDFTTDIAVHPDWFLRGVTGGLLTAPSGFEMDIGNPAYQQACFANAVALAKQGGFDGVYLDGVDASSDYGFVTPPKIPRYPDTAAWRAAMTSLLAYGSSLVHSNGLLLFGNIGGGLGGLWQKWSALLDGSEEESWTDGKHGLAQQVPFWSAKLDNVAWSESHGKYVLLHSWNTTRVGNRFGLASMLLVAGGHTSYSTANGNYLGYQAWYPEYSAAERLGAPLGSYRRLANGVYERRFAGGIVLINPRLRHIRTFSLPGRYSGSGLRGVSSVAMGPLSGLILLSS